MAIVINNKISNEDVSVRENIKQGFLESTKTLNTLLSAVNIAVVYSISEISDVEYNPTNGLIRPLEKE